MLCLNEFCPSFVDRIILSTRIFVFFVLGFSLEVEMEIFTPASYYLIDADISQLIGCLSESLMESFNQSASSYSCIVRMPLRRPGDRVLLYLNYLKNSPVFVVV